MQDDSPLILLVDDDADFLDMTRRALVGQGYKVTCASGPQEALAMMATERPRLVVADLMMNRLDSGFSLSKRIKADPRFGDVPVIIATAIGSRLGLDFSPRKADDLADLRADAYFDKPIASDKLVAKVRELLSGPRREGQGG